MPVRGARSDGGSGGGGGANQWLYFAAGVATSTAATALISHLRRRRRPVSDGRDAPDSDGAAYEQLLARIERGDGDAPGSGRRAAGSPLPPGIRAEQLSRNALYFGTDALDRIRASSLLVVGAGGVGSHAAHLLARSGVERLTVVDFDTVTVSSLNRHACATLADVGTSKVACLRTYLRGVCPDCVVTAVCAMYTEEGGREMLRGDGSGFDYVVDCIDDTPTKVALMAHCVEANIRILSCMGAGGKADPTRVHIGDFASASRDPLAAKARHMLRKRLADPSVIDGPGDGSPPLLEVVYSSEKTAARLADLTQEQKDAPHDFGAVGGMRLRVLPVLGTMPAIMGMAMASRVVTELGGKGFSPVPAERVGKSVRHKLYQRFVTRERRLGQGAEAGPRWTGPVGIDDGDVEYILSELWRNRCAMTGDRLGTVLTLARWDLSRPSSPSNIVLLGAKALAKFDKCGGSREFLGEEDAAVCAKIDRRFASVRESINGVEF